MSDEQKERRINVDELPQGERELAPEESKRVQGGDSRPGVGVLKSLDGGKTWAVSTQGTGDQDRLDDIITGAEPGSSAHVK